MVSLTKLFTTALALTSAAAIAIPQDGDATSSPSALAKRAPPRRATIWTGAENFVKVGMSMVNVPSEFFQAAGRTGQSFQTITAQVTAGLQQQFENYLRTNDPTAAANWAAMQNGGQGVTFATNAVVTQTGDNAYSITYTLTATLETASEAIVDNIVIPLNNWLTSMNFVTLYLAQPPATREVSAAEVNAVAAVKERQAAATVCPVANLPTGLLDCASAEPTYDTNVGGPLCPW